MLQMALLVYVLWVGIAQAQSQDFEAAKKIIMSGNDNGAVACMGCHKQNGAGNASAGFPQLAGMNGNYFSKQIADYQKSQRMNPVMQPIAKGLSENDIKNLAAYFASLPSVVSPKVKGEVNSKLSQQNFELGRAIAERGLWEKGIPACFACHGPGGHGVGSSFPAIANQGQTYVIQQLQAWKKGDRKNDPNQLMATVAKKLTPKEIESVAEFLSSGNVEDSK